MKLLKLIARLLIALIFLYSSYWKLSAPLENFEEVLRAYEIFPEFSIFFLSRAVPVAELIVGACLLFGFLMRLAALASVFFFGSFIFVISRALALKLPLEDCGCFGEGIHLPIWGALSIDIALFLLSLWILFSKPTPLQLDSIIFKRLTTNH